jgi:hypothetical protein
MTSNSKTGTAYFSSGTGTKFWLSRYRPGAAVSADLSTPASTMTRRPPASSISIRRSVECAGALSDEAATDARSPHSATTALTKPASDLVRFAAKALRQVPSRERDKPYRLAVAATRRGSDRLSKTIRAFSSSDQCRRRPVSTTSSRFSADRMAVHTISSQPSGQPVARRPSSEAYGNLSASKKTHTLQADSWFREFAQISLLPKCRIQWTAAPSTMRSPSWHERLSLWFPYRSRLQHPGPSAAQQVYVQHRSTDHEDFALQRGKENFEGSILG